MRKAGHLAAEAASWAFRPASRLSQMSAESNPGFFIVGVFHQSGVFLSRGFSSVGVFNQSGFLISRGFSSVGGFHQEALGDCVLKTRNLSLTVLISRTTIKKAP